MAALCQLQRPQQRLFTHVLDDAGVDAQLDANQLAAIAIKQLLDLPLVYAAEIIRVNIFKVSVARQAHRADVDQRFYTYLAGVDEAAARLVSRPAGAAGVDRRCDGTGDTGAFCGNAHFGQRPQMRVGVDQAGGNDVPCGIKNAVAFCVLLITDADDFSVVDGYVRFGVEFVLRVDHTAIADDDVIHDESFSSFCTFTQYTRFFMG